MKTTRLVIFILLSLVCIPSLSIMGIIVLSDFFPHSKVIKVLMSIIYRM